MIKVDFFDKIHDCCCLSKKFFKRAAGEVVFADMLYTTSHPLSGKFICAPARHSHTKPPTKFEVSS